MLCLISVSGAKHVPAFLAKNFQRRPPIFWHIFGRAPSDLQQCFVQLKTLAPSARYSTCKYTVTLKPRLGSLKVIENITRR